MGGRSELLNIHTPQIAIVPLSEKEIQHLGFQL